MCPHLGTYRTSLACRRHWLDISPAPCSFLTSTVIWRLPSWSISSDHLEVIEFAVEVIFEPELVPLVLPLRLAGDVLVKAEELLAGRLRVDDADSHEIFVDPLAVQTEDGLLDHEADFGLVPAAKLDVAGIDQQEIIRVDREELGGFGIDGRWRRECRSWLVRFAA